MCVCVYACVHTHSSVCGCTVPETQQILRSLDVQILDIKWYNICIKLACLLLYVLNDLQITYTNATNCNGNSCCCTIFLRNNDREKSVQYSCKFLKYAQFMITYSWGYGTYRYGTSIVYLYLALKNQAKAINRPQVNMTIFLIFCFSLNIRLEITISNLDIIN